MSVTGAAALAQAVAQLQSVGIDGAAGDARHLLAAALGVARGRLVAILSDPMPPDALHRFDVMVLARSDHQPVAQILGWRAFWNRRFTVTPDVLDPRPDSETLIECALQQPFSRLLDLGTGSGALAITLLAERPTATGLAVDISPAALAVAARNAQALGVASRLDLCQSDWFAAVNGQFDLIICNPPYIDHAVWLTLKADIRVHEPQIALTPGADGLKPYRHIAKNLARFLTPRGVAVFEIGHDQAAAVQDIMQAENLGEVIVIQDINGKDRVVMIKSI